MKNIFSFWKIIILMCLVLVGLVVWWVFSLGPAIDGERSEDRHTSTDEIVVEGSEELVDESDDPFRAEGDFRLEIKKDGLDISADIVRGVTLADLENGVGRHVTTGYPNEESGNMVLSGHRWYPGDNVYSTIFEDLDQLETGDRVSVFYDNKEFIYEVFDEKIVGSTDVEILEQTEEPQLTLYTCTPKYTSLKRLVYTAKLVEVK